jgi:hypothetical protein
MTSRDFCFWLQGYFEVAGPDSLKRNGLNGRQCEQVQAHLNLVFKHEIDPSMGDNQDELDDIHGNDPMAHTHKPGVRC